MVIEICIGSLGILFGSLSYNKIRNKSNGAENSQTKSWQTSPKAESIFDKSGDKKIAVKQTRSQQLAEISGDSAKQISQRERKINVNLAIATTTLAVTGIGALFHSPLVLLGIPGIVYNSIPHFCDAYKTIFKDKRLGIGALDSVIVIGCLGTGYYFAIATSNFFFYFSRKLLLKTEDSSRKTLTNIFGDLPSHVWLSVNNIELEVPLSTIKSGDTVVVNAGGVIPIDGVIIDGHASIDQHRLTGESQPAEKEKGEQVLASTVVLSGKLYVKVEKAGEDTVVSKIGQILQQTVNSKTALQSRGELIAEQSAAPLLGLGAIALPILGVNGSLAVVNSNFGVNMRVIAPFATLSFLALASRQGILVKDGRVFELLNSVDTIVFDKTGTLTIAQPYVDKVHVFDRLSEDELLTLVAAVEQRQTHPIAKAIQQEAKDRKLDVPKLSETHYEIGYGLEVKMNGHTVLVGSDRFMQMKNIIVTNHLRAIQKECHEQGQSIIIAAIDGKVVGAIELRATVRPEAKAIVKSLKRFGKRTYIISGDQKQPTKKLADDLDIDNYYFDVLPENKASLVDRLQQEGHSVCFIGDGINDSIALKQADVSVSLRGASTIAIDTAQIILMDESLSHLVSLFELARDYESNLRTSYSMTFLPGIVNVCSAFFLSSGIIFSVVLDRVGQFGGIINGVMPLANKKYNMTRADALSTASGVERNE